MSSSSINFLSRRGKFCAFSAEDTSLFQWDPGRICLHESRPDTDATDRAPSRLRVKTPYFRGPTNAKTVLFGHCAMPNLSAFVAGIF